MTKLYPRWQKSAIKHAMTSRRVLLLTGPRQCGKTTLVRELQSDTTEYRTLDDITLCEAAENDPHGFVKYQGSMLIIDEVQRVPSLLPAIKKVVDEDNRPGQYLLTGSANIRSLPGVQESLAGRISKIRLRTLSMGERQQKNTNSPQFLANAFDQSFKKAKYHCDRDAILECAFEGGFPEALTLKGRKRKHWHSDYIDALLERDLKDIAKIHRKEAMSELVHVLAAWSSKFMDIAAIGSSLSIRRPTIESYINALETLYLVERVRPWAKTDYARVGKQSKLFLSDSGLMASILGWHMDQIRLDSDRSGKLIETFAFNELMTHVDAANGVYQLFHYRDREKREIDFLLEREDGVILGLEIKAGSAIRKQDFKHLTWFQSSLIKKDSFIGIILYSGEQAVSFGENLWAVPFSVLWD